VITRNHYRCLGVSRDASARDIKRAFRRLVKQNHPDLHPYDANAGQRMREVIAAYKVLSDPHERERYDRFQDLFGPIATHRPGSPDAGRVWTPRSPAANRSELQRPSAAYAAILLTMIGLSIFMWAQEQDAYRMPGRGGRWTVDARLAEDLSKEVHARDVSIPQPPDPGITIWEIWFWEREYRMNPNGPARRGLIMAYADLRRAFAPPAAQVPAGAKHRTRSASNHEVSTRGA